MLQEGNRRFVEGSRQLPNQDAARLAALTTGQNPFALIFGCSDSRVPAEIIFDRGLGDLFVVRTAGHATDTSVLGSIEYGVLLLGIPLVVVLGHQGCGAVQSTIDAFSSGDLPGGYIRDVVERVTPSLISARRAGMHGEEAVVEEHARLTARLLVDRSPAVAARVAAGTCAIASVRYGLGNATARLIHAIGDIGDPPVASMAAAG